MKKLLFLQIALTSIVSFAQNNTFPTSGNVGIGTTSPQSSLTIYKTPLAYMSHISFGNPTSVAGQASAKLSFAGMGLQHAGFAWIPGSTFENGKLNLTFGESSDSSVNPNKITFQSNGNIGVGTTTPSQKLSVNDNSGNIIVSSFTGGYLLGSYKYTGLTIGETVSVGSSSNIGYMTHQTDKTLSGLYLANYGDGEQGASIFVKKGGKVGVGTISPDEKLTVKGKIHAEEVKIDLLVPADYVFEKYYTGKSSLKADYVMPTLADVEKFTKQNNHLPNIPSAQEIKANGLQLGEMSNLLLQKIEELTLYVIEQNKKIEALEAKLNNK